VVLGALVSMFGINVAASFGAPRLWTAIADRGILPSGLSRKNRFGVPMIAFTITASLALAFPLALRFDNLNLTGLAVTSRFVEFIVVPFAVIALARSRTPEHASVRRNVLTDRVLPIIGVVVTVALVVSFDYRTIFVARGGLNYFSIALVVITYIVVPAVAYVHYYKRSPGRAAAGVRPSGPA
jgi:amino acid transporter